MTHQKKSEILTRTPRHWSGTCSDSHPLGSKPTHGQETRLQSLKAQPVWCTGQCEGMHSFASFGSMSGIRVQNGDDGMAGVDTSCIRTLECCIQLGYTILPYLMLVRLVSDLHFQGFCYRVDERSLTVARVSASQQYRPPQKGQMCLPADALSSNTHLWL